MALFAIGDIHGCFNALTKIFDQGIIKQTDVVVFLGDYIDRGPKSKQIFDWLIEKGQSYHFEFILGNHEIMMMEARISPERFKNWLHVGGSETLNSYKIGDDKDWAKKIDPKHWEFMRNCKPYLQIEEFIFVHAGLDSNKALNAQDENDLYWKKYVHPTPYINEVIVICGHTSRKDGIVANFGHTICIDTFAYGGKWLTCLNVKTNEFIQANDRGLVNLGQA